MGQKVILTCDLHNDNTEAASTLRFVVDARTYELELCDKHLKEFNDKIAPFVNGARSTGGRRASARSAAPSRRRGTRTRRSSQAPESAVVREWARENGYEVSERGRLSSALVEAYHAANA